MTTMLYYGPEGSTESTSVTCNNFYSSASSSHHFVAFVDIFEETCNLQLVPSWILPNFPLTVLMFTPQEVKEKGDINRLGRKREKVGWFFSGLRRNQSCPGVMARVGQGKGLGHIDHIGSFDVIFIVAQRTRARSMCFLGN